MEWGDTALYRVLKKALRSENRELKICFPYLKLCDAALDKSLTIRDIFWRGVSLDIGKEFIKHQLVAWWSVNSCSSSADLIKSFFGKNKTSIRFLIEALNGKKVSGYRKYENEDEHLIETDDNDDEENVTSTMNEMYLLAEPPNQGASDESWDFL